jgi:hypothetical protein
MDGVDNIVLRSMEFLGEEEHREVGVEEAAFFFDIVLNLACQGARVATGTMDVLPGETLSSAVYLKDRMTHIEE